MTFRLCSVLAGTLSFVVTEECKTGGRRVVSKTVSGWIELLFDSVVPDSDVAFGLRLPERKKRVGQDGPRLKTQWSSVFGLNSRGRKTNKKIPVRNGLCTEVTWTSWSNRFTGTVWSVRNLSQRKRGFPFRREEGVRIIPRTSRRFIVSRTRSLCESGETIEVFCRGITDPVLRSDYDFKVKFL